MNKLSSLLAATLLSVPLVALAQNAPQAAVVAGTAPGQAAAAEAVQVQGKVKSIDKKARAVVVVGPQGNELYIAAGEDARNFDQIRVGDLVTLTYVQAIALELNKVDKSALRERVESEKLTRAEPGQKPGGVIERHVQIQAKVTAINPKAQTVTLRGPKRTVDLTVKDPEQLKNIAIGDLVEVKYVEAIALAVTSAPKGK